MSLDKKIIKQLEGQTIANIVEASAEEVNNGRCCSNGLKITFVNNAEMFIYFGGAPGNGEWDNFAEVVLDNKIIFTT